jgi:hypothetical protein
MRRAHVKLQISRRLNGFYPQRNNHSVSARRALNFAHHLTRFVRFAGQNQKKNGAFVNRIDNRSAVIFTRRDIPRRNPARDAVRLEKAADLIPNRFVFRRMTDEYGALHQGPGKTSLLADKNKNPRGQRQNTRKNTWDGDGEEGHETDDDQIYREQKHTDVFREVHALSILIVRPDYNLKTVAPLSLVCLSLLRAVAAVYLSRCSLAAKADDHGIFEFESGTHLVDAVIDHVPAVGFFRENHSFGRDRFFFKRALEQNALVIAVRQADQFFQRRGADEFSRGRSTERGAPALHVTNKLFLRAGNPEAQRFVFECLLVIAVVEHLEPSFRDAARRVFVRAFFSADARMGRAAGEGNQQYTNEDRNTTLHAQWFSERRPRPQFQNESDKAFNHGLHGLTRMRCRGACPHAHL